MTTEAKTTAGLMMASAPASGAGTVSADMRARIGPAVDAKCSHPKGINDLLTITIY